MKLLRAVEPAPELGGHLPLNPCGAFTQPDTETETYTEPNRNLSVSVQYEHLHTILFKPFVISVFISLGVGQCNSTIENEA